MFRYVFSVYKSWVILIMVLQILKTYVSFSKKKFAKY